MKKLLLDPKNIAPVQLALAKINKSLPTDHTMDADWLCSTPLLLEDYLFDLGMPSKASLRGITAEIKMEPVDGRQKGSTRGNAVVTNKAVLSIVTTGTWLVNLTIRNSKVLTRKTGDVGDWRITITPALSPAHETVLFNAIKARYEQKPGENT